MPTTVTNTIGAGAPLYHTIAQWFAACPANLVTSDQIWRGELLNENFDLTGAAISFAGITTDATRYVELTTAAGASFSDNASVQSNALRYNTSNGASISSTSPFASIVQNAIDFTRISKIQFSCTSSTSITLELQKRCVVDRCIIEGVNSSTGVVNTSVGTGGGAVANLTNSLVVQRASAATSIITVGADFTATNCTFVVPSDKTAATYGIDGSFATVAVKNCAIFGATTIDERANSTSFTYTTCRSDAGGSLPSGVTLTTYDTSTGSGFQNTADATRDFRIKTGSALLDVGTTDSTNAGTDIAGTSRPSGSAYDVGAWELVQVGGAFTPNRRKLLLGAG